MLKYGLQCTMRSGASSMAATAAAGGLPDCGKAPVDIDDDGNFHRRLGREATYLLGLRNRLGQWSISVALVASFFRILARVPPTPPLSSGMTSRDGILRRPSICYKEFALAGSEHSEFDYRRAEFH